MVGTDCWGGRSNGLLSEHFLAKLSMGIHVDDWGLWALYILFDIILEEQF